MYFLNMIFIPLLIHECVWITDSLNIFPPTKVGGIFFSNKKIINHFRIYMYIFINYKKEKIIIYIKIILNLFINNVVINNKIIDIYINHNVFLFHL